MFEVFNLQDRPELFENAVFAFWQQWGTETNFRFYQDCLKHAVRTESGLPRFYIALQDGAIIGTYALLRNELISRQDIFPWLACLYVVPEHRGRRIGSELLRHAREETRKLGHTHLYLCTDLDGYYEKHGWDFLANGYLFDGTETRIYTSSVSQK